MSHVLALLSSSFVVTTLAFQAPGVRQRRIITVKAVGLVYSTTTGNTETVAGYIQEAAALPEIVDAADVGDLSAYDGLIVGAPTWHTGADEQRSGTSWDDFLYSSLPAIDLKGKTVAIFGVGDQISYAENFCDAAGELYDCFAKQGATIVGFTDTDAFEHEDSKAIRDGKFVGQMFDEDNQPDLSADRAAAWVKQLKAEGMPF